ncbi:uncharacterized protein LOC112465526 isoform X2 [Temnothorax curvispinosus]|uniref:Uncharacterized protein LOC112465526 isoform X2 n=1 Tax=Temnothorax curvispinosus TaxID=300111 RepID=A0A6J1R2J5_9HYME|nr:uncharacterized protein LOC112465526 isoform X2 [Temnothorax curvispinosus]
MSSAEKRKISSSTDQDSTRKQIRIMNEKQISDKEVENIPKKEQTQQTVSPSHLPLYIKSYSETHIESTIIDHIWKIYQFMRFSTITNTIALPSIPEIEFSRNVTCFEDSTSDEFRFKDEESIKFIVGEEEYVISKKLLCSTNSSYFKNICLTHRGKEKDMTDELIANSELLTFKQILV